MRKVRTARTKNKLGVVLLLLHLPFYPTCSRNRNTQFGPSSLVIVIEFYFLVNVGVHRILSTIPYMFLKVSKRVQILGMCYSCIDFIYIKGKAALLGRIVSLLSYWIGKCSGVILKIDLSTRCLKIIYLFVVRPCKCKFSNIIYIRILQFLFYKTQL